MGPNDTDDKNGLPNVEDAMEEIMGCDDWRNLRRDDDDEEED